jgi:hypothetical protein
MHACSLQVKCGREANDTSTDDQYWDRAIPWI